MVTSGANLIVTGLIGVKLKKQRGTPNTLSMQGGNGNPCHLPPLNYQEIHSMRITIGKKAYKNNQNDYEGMSGEIIWCNKCCKANRIQFDNIGNNEALSNFNLLKCKLSANTK
jgi:hypothetical protein